ncbi:MAG: short-chain dehydrogenase [Acidobacteria bacterium]|nr:MAG: short-chain dehydrogenase [Acidobacteriota bacterium]
MFELGDKVAVVTGAGSGIGWAIARLFAQQGAAVAALDRDEAAASAIAATIRDAGGTASFHRCDVGDEADVAESFRRIEVAQGRVDILVNNAGIAHIGSIETTSPDEFDRLFRVNVRGVYLCSRAAIPIMLGRGGGVVLNMASIASLVGLPDRFAYSMTKGAVLTMTRSIAVDYVKRGIRCNCICPARVHTPFVDGYLAANYPGREAALYLCSDEAGFVTGQAYTIDGGALAR